MVLSLHTSSISVLHTVSHFSSPSFPFFCPFFLSPLLCLSVPFLSIFLLALALTNTLSHRLEEKKRIGVGVVEWGV